VRLKSNGLVESGTDGKLDAAVEKLLLIKRAVRGKRKKTARKLICSKRLFIAQEPFEIQKCGFPQL
jgi:hypothetical protein